MELPQESRNELVRRALEIRSNAYAPYSNYHVGAALLSESGEVFVGANVENAAYPVSMCAERSALFNAVSSGQRKFLAIAVATTNGGSPCGACRQVLSEFGLDTLVLVVNAQGEIVFEATVAELLPQSFGPSNLETD